MAHTSPSRRGTSTIRCPERAPSEAPSRKPHRHTPIATRVRGHTRLVLPAPGVVVPGGNSRGAPGVDQRRRQTTGRGPKAAAGRHRALQARVYQQHCPVSSHEPRRSLLLPTPSSPQLLNHTQPLPRAGRPNQHAHTPSPRAASLQGTTNRGATRAITARVPPSRDPAGALTRSSGAPASQRGGSGGWNTSCGSPAGWCWSCAE